jgi:pyruvate/2-oxoglutarate dehydrogenase complex dihydrolipoamide acyltransferase (E2) component
MSRRRSPAAAPKPRRSLRPQRSRGSGRSAGSEGRIGRADGSNSSLKAPTSSCRTTTCARRSRAACRGQEHDPAFLSHARLRTRRAAGAARAAQRRRAPRRPTRAKPAYKLSVNDMVIKALALALRDVPDANASWTEAPWSAQAFGCRRRRLHPRRSDHADHPQRRTKACRPSPTR